MASGKGAPARTLTLGAHHFAYLRAISEGFAVVDAAARYLAIDKAVAARSAHRELVARVQALARQRGNPRWRLLGVEIREREGERGVSTPSLEEWAVAEGLDDWSHADLLELYAERFGARDEGRERRARRNNRLRAQRVQLLHELEQSVARQPQPLDEVDRWLPEPLAGALRSLGMPTLDDLRQRIGQGGRWWRGLPAYGPTKAARLSALVTQLIGASAPAIWSCSSALEALGKLRGRPVVVHPGRAALPWASDSEAVEAWVQASAKSAHTARSYRREADRFLLWCCLTRDAGLGDVDAQTCLGYAAFLSDIPDGWITRNKVRRLEPDWAPFRGPLTASSQRAAVQVLSAMFVWLVDRGYLLANPWNDRAGAPRSPITASQRSQSRASRVDLPALGQVLLKAPPSPSTARLRWLCAVVPLVGLPPRALIAATRASVQVLPGGWQIAVPRGAGRSRYVAFPEEAAAATVRYFQERGLDFMTAPPQTPLVASLVDPHASISYGALHQTFRSLVRRAERHTAPGGDLRPATVGACLSWLGSQKPQNLRVAGSTAPA